MPKSSAEHSKSALTTHETTYPPQPDGVCLGSARSAQHLKINAIHRVDTAKKRSHTVCPRLQQRPVTKPHRLGSKSSVPGTEGPPTRQGASLKSSASFQLGGEELELPC